LTVEIRFRSIWREYSKKQGTIKAQEWNIEQNLRMTSEQRQDVSKELRERVYGKDTVDIRGSIRCK